MDASSHIAAVETSPRYEGWRIVVVCFLVATFGWGLGFYGQSVYVAELHRLHGWPASLISSGTTFFYLFGALLVAFVSEAIRAFGPRNCLLAGVFALAAAAVSIGQVTEPWQLYLANAVLAFGWAGTSLGIITNTLGLWFDQKRGMAISLALNGASFGGIIGVPLLVAAIGSFGFSGAMIAAAATMLVVMIPVILIFVGPAPNRGGIAAGQAAADAPSASQIRAHAFRDIAFLTVSIAFALVLFAQVGFIVHLIAFLDPVIGRQQAATAVALLTAMAMAGRVLFSTVIDRLNQRLASAISFASQAVALLILINSRNETLRPHPEGRALARRLEGWAQRHPGASWFETREDALLTMRVLRFPLPQEIVKIEPLREHRKLAVRRARPLLLRAVPVELDAIF